MICGLRIGEHAWTCQRFACWRCESVLILCNAVLLSKAHLDWDKYALPMIVLLW